MKVKRRNQSADLQPANYNAVVSLASQEQKKDCRSELVTKVENMDSYDADGRKQAYEMGKDK